MNTVRIGCVKYLNTLPLIEGLGMWRGCELVTSAPSGLIGMLRRGEVDVALASVVDGARGVADAKQSTTAPTDVVLLPVGMIGCEGRTLTVRVFSRVPIERITRVVVDAESHTSVVLLQVLMCRKFGKRVEVEVGRDQGIEGSRHLGEGGEEAIQAAATRIHHGGFQWNRHAARDTR